MSIIDIAIRVNKFAFAISLTIYPIAFVLGSIRPNLHAIAILDFALPGAFVCDSIFESD
jgi:hypothetical protein